MKARCRLIGACTFVSALLAWPHGASAQFGGLQRVLFRGAEYAGNNLFLSNPQGGPLFDFNIFRQRVEYNRAGQGYTYEFYRFFGPDSFGNTNTLDLGPFKMELGIDPQLLPSGQPVGIHGRTGFTTRFIPEVFFEAQTGQRTYSQFSGLTAFNPAPLNYTVSFNAGVQDLAWRGNALIDMSGRINALGFYDLDFRLTNVGSFEAGGVVLHDEQVTDFDVGPINVSGHILLDGVAALLQADGAAADAAAPRIYSGAAQKDRTVDDLLAVLRGGGTLTDGELQFLTSQMITAAFITDPLGVLTNGVPAALPGFEGLTLSITEPAEGTAADLSETSRQIPEPGTIGLLITVATALAVMRPFSRRRLLRHLPGRSK